MCLMASANHMLIIFLGVEMASVPSYALAGMLKGRRQSSEAALSTPCTAPARPASCCMESVCYPACWARPHADHGAQFGIDDST